MDPGTLAAERRLTVVQLVSEIDDGGVERGMFERAGGICISGSVVDAIGTKLRLDFNFMGEQVVKNIARPIRAYHVVLLEDRVADQQSGEQKAPLLENPSIAVLPFVNMSPDEEQEFLSTE